MCNGTCSIVSLNLFTSHLFQSTTVLVLGGILVLVNLITAYTSLWSTIPVSCVPDLEILFLSLVITKSSRVLVVFVILVGSFITFDSLYWLSFCNKFLPSNVSALLFPLNSKSAFKSPTISIFFLLPQICSNYFSKFS